MARPKKESKQEIIEDIEESAVKPTVEQFDPSIPESKQRHLR
jgi:hypothetical protein